VKQCRGQSEDCKVKDRAKDAAREGIAERTVGFALRIMRLYREL
jgi:hypothetical protein